MLYPLFFEPVYKEIMWGGRNLKRYFKRQIPEGNIAESWDVSCHKSGMSIIKNGSLQGKTLSEAINLFGSNLLGSKYSTFPLLIKLIDANDSLSVQVHPNDEYAKRVENQFGKTEMWYVIDAKKDAKLVYGLKSKTTKEEFKNAIETNNVEEYLNFVSVEKGDVIYIPSGTVHAIMDGLLLAEIQQSSDVTYRIYDWNRTDKNGNKRELHVEKSLDVINFDFEGKVIKPSFIAKDENLISNVIKSEYFNVNVIRVNNFYENESIKESFTIYTVVEGEGEIIHENNSYKIKNGDSFLIPSCLGKYKICGSLNLLETTV